MSNPNMPPNVPGTPHQERIRPPMTPEEQHYAELPDQVIPLGRAALLKVEVGGLDTIGEYDRRLGQNTMVTRELRGLRPNGQPIYGNEVSRKPVMGMTTAERMAVIDNRAARAGQVDKPTAAYNVEAELRGPATPPQPKRIERPQPQRPEAAPVDDEDFSNQSHLIHQDAQNRKARQRRGASPKPAQESTAKAQPGARAAAEAAAAAGRGDEDFSDDIPRAVEPLDLRDSGPRRDRRRIEFE